MNKEAVEVGRENSCFGNSTIPLCERDSVGFGNTVNHFLKEQNNGSFSIPSFQEMLSKGRRHLGTPGHVQRPLLFPGLTRRVPTRKHLHSSSGSFLLSHYVVQGDLFLFVLISYAGQRGPTLIVREHIRVWRPTFQNIIKGLCTREFPVRSVRVLPLSPITHKKLKSARLVFASVRFKWSRCLSASVRPELSQYFHSNPPRLPLSLQPFVSQRKNSQVEI